MTGLVFVRIIVRMKDDATPELTDTDRFLVNVSRVRLYRERGYATQTIERVSWPHDIRAAEASALAAGLIAEGTGDQVGYLQTTELGATRLRELGLAPTPSETVTFEVDCHAYRTTLDVSVIEALDGGFVSDAVRAAAVRAALGLDRPLTDADRKFVADFTGGGS